jgi:hypothetical protein
MIVSLSLPAFTALQLPDVVSIRQLRWLYIQSDCHEAQQKALMPSCGCCCVRISCRLKCWCGSTACFNVARFALHPVIRDKQVHLWVLYSPYMTLQDSIRLHLVIDCDRAAGMEFVQAFRDMINTVGAFGNGYKRPSAFRIANSLLQTEYERVSNLVEECED